MAWMLRLSRDAFQMHYVDKCQDKYSMFAVLLEKNDENA